MKLETMKRTAQRHFEFIEEPSRHSEELEVNRLRRLREILGLPSPRSASFVSRLPFTLNDVTAGTETELQAAALGQKESVDLPLVIKESNYFANMLKRVHAGDADSETVSEIERFLNENSSEVWENSWVRFPRERLHESAQQVLEADLRSNKMDPTSPPRTDANQFVFWRGGQEWVRVPISYLIKLALADFLGAETRPRSNVTDTAWAIMDKFFSDNTSPETVSLYITPLSPETEMGLAAAKETSLRFLLTHLLVSYANHKFGLKGIGQEAVVYMSPHPPLRQKKLSECVSDAFYRELFMSPCLSGWNDGQRKKAYMHLCHEVLSRSQLNATAKLRESGIMTRKLVFFPTLASTSLSNNGAHVSLGSRKLTALLRDDSSGFTSAHEKCLGDLVVKVAEHFLPLFVGTYSAAPFKLDFCDFHPEKVLGFLPHELDYTHLRMLWRCWKKKARLEFLGRSITPFGVKTLDHAASSFLRLRGDFVPDFRLIDYFVALMSTNRSPALDGTPGNLDRLKDDLMSLGVFDNRLSPYMLCRMREFSHAGFSGFEGRYYSLFASLKNDLSHAINLQNLVLTVAFKLVLQGRYTHHDIPDDPSTESERRQIFFGRAIGLPVFYVRNDTRNSLLKEIVQRTAGATFSRRYSRYIKVFHASFQKALLQTLIQEGADIIDLLGVQPTIADLKARMENYDEQSVAGKLRSAIADKLGINDPLCVSGDEFNSAAENYYRTELRYNHLAEAIDFLKQDVGRLPCDPHESSTPCLYRIHKTRPTRNLVSFVASRTDAIIQGAASFEDIVAFIELALMVITENALKASQTMKENSPFYALSPSVH